MNNYKKNYYFVPWKRSMLEDHQNRLKNNFVNWSQVRTHCGHVSDMYPPPVVFPATREVMEGYKNVSMDHNSKKLHSLSHLQLRDGFKKKKHILWYSFKQLWVNTKHLNTLTFLTSVKSWSLPVQIFFGRYIQIFLSLNRKKSCNFLVLKPF